MSEDLLKSLYSRLSSLDVNAPYMWQLAISSAEFQALEEAIVGQAANGITPLLTCDWARRCIAYLAEWCKRRYAGNDSHPLSICNTVQQTI